MLQLPQLRPFSLCLFVFSHTHGLIKGCATSCSCFCSVFSVFIYRLMEQSHVSYHCFRQSFFGGVPQHIVCTGTLLRSNGPREQSFSGLELVQHCVEYCDMIHHLIFSLYHILVKPLPLLCWLYIVPLLSKALDCGNIIHVMNIKYTSIIVLFFLLLLLFDDLHNKEIYK